MIQLKQVMPGVYAAQDQKGVVFTASLLAHGALDLDGLKLAENLVDLMNKKPPRHVLKVAGRYMQVRHNNNGNIGTEFGVYKGNGIERSSLRIAVNDDLGEVSSTMAERLCETVQVRPAAKRKAAPKRQRTL